VRPEVSGVTQATTFPRCHDAYRMRAKCGYKVSRRFVKPLSLGQQLTIVLLEPCYIVCAWGLFSYIADPRWGITLAG
jgi:hypothetical protein